MDARLQAGDLHGDNVAGTEGGPVLVGRGLRTDCEGRLRPAEIENRRAQHVDFLSPFSIERGCAEDLFYIF